MSTDWTNTEHIMRPSGTSSSRSYPTHLDHRLLDLLSLKSHPRPWACYAYCLRSLAQFRDQSFVSTRYQRDTAYDRNEVDPDPSDFSRGVSMSSYQQATVTLGTDSVVGNEEAQKLLADQGLSETPDLTTIIEADYDDTIRHQVELLEYSRARRGSFALIDNGVPEEHYYHEDHKAENTLRTVDEEAPLQTSTLSDHRTNKLREGFLDWLKDYVAQLPAVLVTVLLILMAAVPFGVAYFPVGWSNDPTVLAEAGDPEGDVRGSFPIPGKEAMGIRMCLFATMVGQIVMTLTSGFENPVCFQLLYVRFAVEVLRVACVFPRNSLYIRLAARMSPSTTHSPELLSLSKVTENQPFPPFSFSLGSLPLWWGLFSIASGVLISGGSHIISPLMCWSDVSVGLGFILQ